MIARLLTLLALFIVTADAVACKCAAPPPTATTYRALAEWEASRTAVIFEGTVENISVTGWPITPEPGKTISMHPRLNVSFSGVRTYRGDTPADLRVETGVGDGDCGFPFERGESYLVFASNEDGGGHSTGICSSTAKLRNAGAELRVLRGEPPTEADLIEWRSQSHQNPSTSAPSPRLCGKVTLPKGLKPAGMTVVFWRAEEEDIALFRYLTADAEDDGHYCVDLEPDKYLVGALQPPEKRSRTRLMGYYPGVAERSQAKQITVGNGRNENVDFPLPAQAGYRIHGYLRGSPEGSQRPIVVVLISDVPDHFHVVEPVPLGPHGTFDFSGILPGHYTAFAAAVDDGESITFLSSVVDVTISKDLTGLRLDYVEERK